MYTSSLLWLVCWGVLSIVLAVPNPPECPTLHSKSVEVSCLYDGSPRNCTENPSPPGTVATFKCKPLYEVLFGYDPPTGYNSHCGDDGEWSVQPFRCVPICGRPTSRPTAYVRNGEVVSSGAAYPWHVTIYKNDKKAGLIQICGGSLIRTKFFVSAAHCFYTNQNETYPIEIFTVAFGRTKRDFAIKETDVQYRKLIKIIGNNYGGKKFSYSNDIVLVEVDEEVVVTSWTLPVCVDWGLTLPDLKHGQMGTVVGFGATDILQFGEFPFIGKIECKKNITTNLAASASLPEKFCVGFMNDMSVGPGDSGGGLAFKAEDGNWYLRGVVSTGAGSGSKLTNSFFTNVTVFIPWMSTIIQSGEVTGQRCGVDITESSIVDNARVGSGNFPWDVDVYGKDSEKSRFKRLWGAVLVKPNVAITSSRGWNEIKRSVDVAVDLPAHPVQWLRVASRQNTDFPDLSKAAIITEIVRIISSNIRKSNSANVVLLELKQHINLMPVCLDRTGDAFLQRKETGTTIGNNETQVWHRFTIFNSTQCFDVLTTQLLCVELQPHMTLQRSISLVVNEGNTWFLRGIWLTIYIAYDHKRTAGYADISDPYMIKWLDWTLSQDLLRPPCGKINLCQSLSIGETLTGHLPWTVSVVVDNDYSEESVVFGGVLLQSNAVLTGFRSTLTDNAALENGLFYKNFKRVSILWTEEGRTMRSDVVNITNRKSRDFEFFLLEINTTQAISATPVCIGPRLDEEGKVSKYSIGLAEAWQQWSPSNHTLFISKVNRFIEDNARFEAKPTSVTVNVTMGGSGYFIMVDGRYYIQGLFEPSEEFDEGVQTVRSMINDDIQSWLRKKLDELPKVQSNARVSTRCVGTVKSECGLHRISSQILWASPMPLAVPRSDHMEWNVRVHVDYKTTSNQLDIRSGTVVSAKMVITSSDRLVAEEGANNKTSVRTIPASDVLVKKDDGYGPASQVERIHVRERTNQGSSDSSLYDVALLELKTPMSVMPVCVPPVSPPLEQLQTRRSGQVEVFPHSSNLKNVILPTVYAHHSLCKRSLGRSEATDEDQFCAFAYDGSELEVKLEVELGAAYLVETKGKWYLRGVRGKALTYNSSSRYSNGFKRLTNFDRTSYLEEVYSGTLPSFSINVKDAFAFYNLDNTELLVWLTAMIAGAKGSTHTDTPTKNTIRSTTIATLPEPAPPTQCGETSAPLDSVPRNGSVSGHLPWSVVVTKADADGDIKVTAGVLIRPDTVLTQGHTLVAPMGRCNDSGDVSGVDVQNIIVYWTSHSRGGIAGSEVVELLVRDRDQCGDRPWGVALLRLKTPYWNSALPCLDLTNITANLAQLASGQIGVLETWRGHFSNRRSRFLISAPFLTAEDCRQKISVTLGTLRPDMFCTEKLSETVRDGAAYLVKTGEHWYVRGVLSRLGDEHGVFGVTDLQDESVKGWLRENVVG